VGGKNILSARQTRRQGCFDTPRFLISLNTITKKMNPNVTSVGTNTTLDHIIPKRR